MCVCVCVFARAFACMRACMRACLCLRVRASLFRSWSLSVCSVCLSRSHLHPYEGARCLLVSSRGNSAKRDGDSCIYIEVVDDGLSVALRCRGFWCCFCLLLLSSFSLLLLLPLSLSAGVAMYGFLCLSMRFLFPSWMIRWLLQFALLTRSSRRCGLIVAVDHDVDVLASVVVVSSCWQHCRIDSLRCV